MIPINNAGVGLPDNPLSNNLGGNSWLPVVILTVAILALLVGYVIWMRRG
jgi:hypothetical protein